MSCRLVLSRPPLDASGDGWITELAVRLDLDPDELSARVRQYPADLVEVDDRARAASLADELGALYGVKVLIVDDGRGGALNAASRRVRRSAPIVVLVSAAIAGAWWWMRHEAAAPSVSTVSPRGAPIQYRLDADATYVVVPDGDVPSGGWPTMVLLHGHRASKENFRPFADRVATHDMAALAVDAPMADGAGGRIWPDREATHLYLRGVVGRYAHDTRLDMRRPWIGGFSQGGALAAQLVAEHPSDYTGALVVAPAGDGYPAPDLAHTGRRPLYVLVGSLDTTGLELAHRLDGIWRTAEQPSRMTIYEGGPQPPNDWPTYFAEALPWLESAARP